MCTSTSTAVSRAPSPAAGARTDPSRQQRQPWAKPGFVELRLGFEVTLYSGYR
ncbi:MAG TPA: pyrroloquinoline quinone precursor peptide PqqA [Polyangiaceae bacterium]|nr:pyrroloquinoline quinone precursor peptide PqqA [Polyangiaceae bacterium]